MRLVAVLIGHEEDVATRPSSAGISSIIAVPGNQHFLCSSYDGEIHEVAASNKPKLSRQPC